MALLGAALLVGAELFTSTAVLAWLPGGRPPAEVRSGLRTLHRLHLVTDTGGPVVMHALVQRAVRERLGPADLVPAAPATRPGRWPRSRPC